MTIYPAAHTTAVFLILLTAKVWNTRLLTTIPRHNESLDDADPNQKKNGLAREHGYDRYYRRGCTL